MKAFRAKNDGMKRMLKGQVLSSVPEKKHKRRADALLEMLLQYFEVASKGKNFISVS